jgi:hypothetical protein
MVRPLLAGLLVTWVARRQALAGRGICRTFNGEIASSRPGLDVSEVLDDSSQTSRRSSVWRIHGTAY